MRRRSFPGSLSRGARLGLLWSAAIAIVAAGPLFVSHGVPALQQDWQWPVYRAQCSALTSVGSSPWNPNGAGFPQIYPEAWWPYVVMGSLCTAVGPSASAALYVLLCALVAGLTFNALSSRLNFSPFARVVAITIYVGSPVLFNETQAGHTLFLFSYALLPALAFAAMSESRYRPAYCGVLLGLIAAQQQFFIFGEIVIVALLFTKLSVKRLTEWVAINVLAIAICAPMWILALQPSAIDSFSAYRPVLHWEYAQSAVPLDALRLLGYTGHYDAQRFGWKLRIALWSVPLLSAYALSTREPVVRRFGLCAVLAVLFVMGLYGPLSIPLASAFEHVPAMIVFRELYGFAAIVALSYSCLVGAALSSRRTPFRAATAVLGIIAFVTGVTIALQTSRGIPHYAVDTAGTRTLSAIADQRSSGRFLAIPSEEPYVISGERGTGKLPFALAIGPHAPAQSALPSFPETFVARAIQGDPKVAELLGISTVVTVPHVRGAFTESLEPALRGIVDEPPRATASQWSIRQTSGSLVAISPISSAPGSLENIGNAARDIDAVRGGKSIDMSAQTTLDPRRGWARTSLWRDLPLWIYSEPLGVFTLTRSAEIMSPRDTLVIAGDATGGIRARNCATEARLSGHFLLFRCNSAPVFEGIPPLAIASATYGGGVSPTVAQTGTFGDARILHYSPYRIVAHIDASPRSAIVLRESFDPRWTISTATSAHIRVDGYANAWITKGPIHKDVTIEYAPAARFYICEIISVALVTLAAAAGVAGHIARWLNAYVREP